jgi:uncharacterized iron-regulated membrane protein
MTFRVFLRWVHLILGLTGAVVLALVALTGTYITFQDPLTHWLNPVPVVRSANGTADMRRILSAVEQRYPGEAIATVDVREHEATVVRLIDKTTVFVDPFSETILSVRPRRFASLENLTLVMRALHTNLVIGPKGRMIVVLATFEALLLALTGLWLWWRKRHWRFRRLRGSLFRVSWDLHNATGIWFVLPVLAMVVTGLLLGVPEPVYRMAGAEPAPWLDLPESPAPEGGLARIPVSRALEVADSARPSSSVTRLAMPPGPRGVFSVRKAGETILVDQYRASVLDIRRERALTAGDEAILAVEDIHTGARFGVPGRTIMTLGSLMLAVMTLTGAVLGVKRLMILAGSRAGASES